MVKPYYEILGSFLPTLNLDVFEKNKEEWKKLIEHYED